jgi:hypothetical protein
MVPEPIPDRELRARLESSGIGATDVTQITNSATQLAYRVETGDATLYAKLLPADRVERYRTLVKLEGVGLPESEVLDGDVPVLVTRQAEGRLLSRLLPVALLPVAWRASADGLAAGYERAGRYLGRLHRGTLEGYEPIERRSSLLEVDEDARELLEESVVERVRHDLDALRGQEAPFSLAHEQLMPHNVFYADGDVELIDFELGLTTCLKDQLLFECGTELMAARLPYGRRSQAIRLVRAFRRGYDDAGPAYDVSTRAMRALKASRFVSILGYYARMDDPNELHSRLTRYTDVRILRSRIEAYARA